MFSCSFETALFGAHVFFLFFVRSFVRCRHKSYLTLPPYLQQIHFGKEFYPSHRISRSTMSMSYPVKGIRQQRPSVTAFESKFIPSRTGNFHVDCRQTAHGSHFCRIIAHTGTYKYRVYDVVIDHITLTDWQLAPLPFFYPSCHSPIIY
jgi:hypothetical protein